MFSCLLLLCARDQPAPARHRLLYFGKTPGKLKHCSLPLVITFLYAFFGVCACVYVCVARGGVRAGLRACSFPLLFVIGVECKVTVSDPHECRSSSLTVNWVLLAVG